MSVKSNQKAIRIQLGRELLKARKAKGYSQRKLAEHLGLTSSQFISNIERGLGKLPPHQYGPLSELLDKKYLKRMVELSVREYRERYLAQFR